MSSDLHADDSSGRCVLCGVPWPCAEILNERWVQKESQFLALGKAADAEIHRHDEGDYRARHALMEFVAKNPELIEGLFNERDHLRDLIIDRAVEDFQLNERKRAIGVLNHDHVLGPDDVCHYCAYALDA